MLTAALVAPYFIDWTSYRADFEREATRILGRKVTVEGAARARLLPFPSVTFTDVTVAGGQNGAPAMTVDEFSMDAELAPFLRGEVLIFDMRVVKPKARIVVAKDGRIDWAVRPSSPYDASQITLEKVTVEDGSVDLVHEAGGRTHHLTGIDADLSARSLAGPWRIDGSLALDGVPTQLSIATGKVEPGNGLRVHVQAVPSGYPLQIETDGRITIDDEGAAAYAGGFRLVNQAAAANPERGGQKQQREAPANRVTGRFALSNQRLSIDEFRLETGSADNPYTADGKAFIELGQSPRFEVTADGAQINFDEPQGDEESPADGSMALGDRLASFRRFLLGVPRPSMPGTVRVNLPAIVAGDTTIRSISLVAEPAPEGWSIGSVAATLPGRTRFEAHGLLSSTDDLRFKGSIVLAVRQPSGFAAWLARDVDEAIRRLPAAGFSADVDLGPQSQSFDKLQLILGDAKFHGSATRRAPGDARPSMTVKLKGDALDVDGMAAFASLFVSDEGTMRLGDHDIDFDIAAGPVTAAGLKADAIDTALRLQGGTLEIDRLKVDGLEGANISATGTVKDFAGAPTGKLDASIVSVDLAPLVSALAGRFPGNRLVGFLRDRAHFYPGLLEDSEIDFIASAAANKDGSTGVALSANGKAGGTGFSLSSSGAGRADDLAGASFTADFTAHNDEAANLYALYGIPALPLGLAGAAETELSVRGSPAGEMETRLTFGGDGLAVNAGGTLRVDGEHPSFTGKGSLEADDLEPWLAAAGVALPGFGYGLPTTLSSPIDLHEGRLSFGKLDGSVAASAVGGNIVAEMGKERPHLTGSLKLASLDMELPLAMALGNSALAIGPGVDWPDQPFQRDVVTPASADVKLAVDKLYVGRTPVGAKAAMDFSLDGEGVKVENFAADLDGGKLTGRADVRNNGGSALFSAQMKLAGADLAKVLPDGALSGTVDFGSGLTSSGKSVAGLVSALSGSGSMSFDGLTIDGLNPKAFGPIIDRANAIGHQIKAKDVADFAPPLIRDGRFDGGAGEVAFTIAGGVLRTPPLQLHDGRTELRAETRIDLGEGATEIKGSLAYEPGLEAVTGSDPLVQFTASGPIGDMKAEIDTQTLAQYLTQRALEREEARVEHMQAVLLEKQRLRRETDYFASLDEDRRQAEQERLHFEMQAERARADAERRAQEEAEKARQEEERRRAEEEEKARTEPPPTPEGAPARPSATEGDAIRREPLPAPSQPAEGAKDERAPDADVQDYFNGKNLSVDGLMKLLGPRKQGE